MHRAIRSELSTARCVARIGFVALRLSAARWWHGAFDTIIGLISAHAYVVAGGGGVRRNDGVRRCATTQATTTASSESTRAPARLTARSGAYRSSSSSLTSTWRTLACV